MEANGPLPGAETSPGSSSMQQQQQQQEQPTSSSSGGGGTQPSGPRHIGSCKWFNATKGYGFITSGSPGEGGEAGGGEDLFVHQSNIISEGFRSLREGETVEYDTETTDGRTKAINVTGPGGAPPQGAPPRNRLPNTGFRGGMGGRRGGRATGGMGMMGGVMGVPGRGVAPTAATYANPYGYPAMPNAAAAAAAAAAVQPYYYGYYYPQPADYAVRGGRGARMPGRGMPAAPMMYPSVPPMGMEQPSGLQVVVHNLPWSCTWQQLKDYFRDFKVERADIVEDQWGRSRGFGTVRFSTPEDAQMACDTLSNSQIEGRTISVRIDRFA